MVDYLVLVTCRFVLLAILHNDDFLSYIFIIPSESMIVGEPISENPNHINFEAGVSGTGKVWLFKLGPLIRIDKRLII